MATLTKPYVFTAGGYAVADQVNADFDAVYAWINGGGAMWNDGTTAFTAVPTGPNLNPTAGNHLTRKAYVDAQVSNLATSLADVAVDGMGPTKLYLQGGFPTVATSGGGVGSITFGTAFPHSCIAVVACTDSNFGADCIVQVNHASFSRTGFQLRTMTASNTGVNVTMPIHYIAIGT